MKDIYEMNLRGKRFINWYVFCSKYKMLKKRLTYRIVSADLICSWDVSSWERVLWKGLQILKNDKKIKILVQTLFSLIPWEVMCVIFLLEEKINTAVSIRATLCCNLADWWGITTETSVICHRGLPFIDELSLCLPRRPRSEQNLEQSLRVFGACWEMPCLLFAWNGTQRIP